MAMAIASESAARRSGQGRVPAGMSRSPTSLPSRSTVKRRVPSAGRRTKIAMRASMVVLFSQAPMDAAREFPS